MQKSLVPLFVMLMLGEVMAQTPSLGQVPRMPDGRPDLTGIWTTQTFTPLQRPEQFAGRALLTEEEMATLTKVLTAPGVDPLRGRAFADALSSDSGRRLAATAQDDPTHYDNSMWLRSPDPKGLSSRRTSLIVDPANGRIPSRTAVGRGRARRRQFERGYDSYQNRPAQERCLVWNHEGPPMMPAPYNDLYQIFQTPDHVVVFAEMAATIPSDYCNRWRAPSVASYPPVARPLDRPLGRRHTGG